MLPEHTDGSRFNDDLVLILYGLVDLKTYFSNRLVCKRWYDLSYNRGVLCRYYNAARLHLAFGPAFWHSPEELVHLISRNHQLEANFALAEPVARLNREIQLKDIRTFKLCGPYIFLLQFQELGCYDFHNAELRPLWKYEFTKASETRRLCAYESSYTEEAGQSIASLVLCDLFTITLFKLHIYRKGESVEITQQQKSEYSFGWEAPATSNGKLAVQGDWILVSGMHINAFLLHTPSSVKYFLKKNQNIHLITVFAGSRLVASYMEYSTGGVSISLYEIPTPDSDGRSPQTGEIDWTYLVPVSEIMTQFHFVGSRSTGVKESISFLGGVRDTWGRYSPTPLTIRLSLGAIKYNCKNVAHPISTIRDPFIFEQNHLRVFQKTCFSPIHFPNNRFGISHVSIAVNEDGSYYLGEAGVWKLSGGVRVVDTVELDELLGRVYIFNRAAQGWRLRVISYV